MGIMLIPAIPCFIYCCLQAKINHIRFYRDIWKDRVNTVDDWQESMDNAFNPYYKKGDNEQYDTFFHND